MIVTKNPPLSILVVEDDLLWRDEMSSLLNKFGSIVSVSSLSEAVKVLEKQDVDLAFVDLNLSEDSSDLSGISIIKQCAKKDIYNVVVSFHASKEIIMQAYEAGCVDYLEKASKNMKDAISAVVDRYYAAISEKNCTNRVLESYLTRDKETIATIKYALSNRTNSFPIYISGETGVGKTLLARLIHEQSSRPGEYVDISCAGMNENLIESELFGHAKGAFTGAGNERQGKLSLANNGTLFIDEICSMPLKTQAMLLKVIEEKSFYRVGSEKKISSNFRLVTASHENLLERVKTGEFREDLYYRIFGVNLLLKPLRERVTDIEYIIETTMSKSIRKKILSPQAKAILMKYKWPGNIRELIKVISLFMNSERPEISTEELPANIVPRIDDDHVFEPIAEYITQHGYSAFKVRIEKYMLQKLGATETKTDEILAVMGFSPATYFRKKKSLRNEAKIYH